MAVYADLTAGSKVAHPWLAQTNLQEILLETLVAIAATSCTSELMSQPMCHEFPGQIRPL